MMVVTDTFARFARRMAATQGWPYVIVAQTENPIRQLDPEALRARAEQMIETVVEGLTLPPAEIEARLEAVAHAEIHPEGIVRSASPV
ncbi:MAG TPA: hypothetical protein VNK67_01610 [Burkholderiales bacterium]|nr:hypothetical protein [Burkholderiales bacterium]